MAATVARWLAGTDADARHWQYEDFVAWPDNGPCHTAD
jgi:hypothetical protein